MEIHPEEPPEKIEDVAGREAIKKVMPGVSPEAQDAVKKLTEKGQRSEMPPEGSPEEMALNVLEMLRRKWRAALDKLTPRGQG